MLILLWRPLAIGGGVQTGNVRTLGDYHAPSYNWPAPKRKQTSAPERKRRQVVESVTPQVTNTCEITDICEVVTKRVTPPPRRLGPRLRPLVPTKRRVPSLGFERAALVLLPPLDVRAMVPLGAMEPELLNTLRENTQSDDALMAVLLCVTLDD